MTQPMFDFAREKGVEKKIGQLNPLKRGALAKEVHFFFFFFFSLQLKHISIKKKIYYRWQQWHCFLHLQIRPMLMELLSLFVVVYLLLIQQNLVH